MMKTIFAMLVCLVLLAGCQRAYDQPHTIQFYSGGQLIRSWTSVGYVENLERSNSYSFIDSETKKKVRVTGDLVISPE